MEPWKPNPLVPMIPAPRCAIRAIDESMGGRLLWQERYQTHVPFKTLVNATRAARERTWQAKAISITNMPLLLGSIIATK
jgi:hypothetical protein